MKPAVFDRRSYGIFGFLAGARNYSAVQPISMPRGLPEDVGTAAEFLYESWGTDAHTPSWLTLDELEAFDYDKPMEDRRVLVQLASNLWSGGETAEPGGGKWSTYREFLGTWYFDELRRLRENGVERIVFWFDN